MSDGEVESSSDSSSYASNKRKKSDVWPFFQKKGTSKVTCKLCPIPRDNDALEWWKMNASRFPRLAEIARRLLCVPASSTASERLFSTAGSTVSKIRNSLKPENVDALLFLNKNCSLL